ncbi:MAG TPA: polysaccharide deacetylase family protein [Candidatus Eremiobacteraceae bacterium]|jgi:peptidoglycan/xylan/chitin deacetylase (PgdA/CDA1 family)|nr:polysaccharide deacetylase family protein [Candidatus Eremiobacteraceae bacterium]
MRRLLPLLVLGVALFMACATAAPPARAATSLASADALPATGEHPHPGGMAPDGRVWFVPMQRKEIALTFDDGPYPFYTPLLLHQLEADGTPATFFLVGRTMQEYPELVERIIASGGELGNHTFNHFTLTSLSDDEIEDQISACGGLIESYTGGAPTLFRPPHGHYDTRVLDIARKLGYRTILWSDAPDDAKLDNRELPVSLIVERVVKHATPGGIVLLHSGQYNTAMALAEIIPQLRAEGYTFVTVSQLLAHQDL